MTAGPHALVFGSIIRQQKRAESALWKFFRYDPWNTRLQWSILLDFTVCRRLWPLLWHRTVCHPTQTIWMSCVTSWPARRPDWTSKIKGSKPLIYYRLYKSHWEKHTTSLKRHHDAKGAIKMHLVISLAWNWQFNAQFMPGRAYALWQQLRRTFRCSSLQFGETDHPPETID